MDRQVDWRKILKLSSSLKSSSENSPFQEEELFLLKKEKAGRRIVEGKDERIRIGIARDAAFSFYYQDNLDLLKELGAELVPFSPIKDFHLPHSLSGLYLGGGFPEIYAEYLQKNKSILLQIYQAIESGMPVYAECGGLIYLGKTITTYDRKKFRMVGALALHTKMTEKISMAYVHCNVRKSSILAKRGEKIPGQIFHFSTLLEEGPLNYSYKLTDGSSHWKDGILYKNLLASYVHLHFWSKISLAKNFINKCWQWKNQNN